MQRNKQLSIPRQSKLLILKRSDCTNISIIITNTTGCGNSTNNN